MVTDRYGCARLGQPEILRASLGSANLKESLFSVARQATRRVRRCRNADQPGHWPPQVNLL